MRSSWIHIIAVSTFLIAGGLGLRLKAEDDKVVRAAAGHEGFDSSVRPQDDFFRHVNGGWIASTEIPPDRPAFGSFFQLRDKSESNSRAIIEAAAAGTDNSAGSEARKIGDLYKSFANEVRAEQLGKKPIEADFSRIDAIAEKSAFIPTIASFQREGVTGLFMAFVSN